MDASLAERSEGAAGPSRVEIRFDLMDCPYSEASFTPEAWQAIQIACRLALVSPELHVDSAHLLIGAAEVAAESKSGVVYSELVARIGEDFPSAIRGELPEVEKGGGATLDLGVEFQVLAVVGTAAAALTGKSSRLPVAPVGRMALDQAKTQANAELEGQFESLIGLDHIVAQVASIDHGRGAALLDRVGVRRGELITALSA